MNDHQHDKDRPNHTKHIKASAGTVSVKLHQPKNFIQKATCVYDCVCVHCTMGEERIHFCWTIIHTFWWSVDMMISKLERKLKKLLYAGNKAMTQGKNIFLYSSYSRGWEREKHIQKLLHMKYSMIRRIWEN